MSEEQSVNQNGETSRTYTKAVKVDNENKQKKNKYNKRATKDGEKRKSLLRRLPNIETAVIPAFGRFRRSIQKLNCFKNRQDDEVPMMSIPRHKSIDIGVGLARRMSLFLFTKRTVCVHPYHPFTPEQTTRKIYMFPEDK